MRASVWGRRVSSPDPGAVVPAATALRESAAAERYFVASQWQLMWRKFRRHRMALVGGGVLLFLYLTTAVAGFLSPYEKATRDADYLLAPPQQVRLFHDGRLLGPFVYSLQRTRDPETLQRIYTENTGDPHRIRFFVRTDRYKFLGFIRTDLHLFGVHPPATLYLFGTDELGRDMFSRVLYAGRVSLSVGLLGVAISFLLGVVIGGVSGYVGGAVDTVIQRIIEFLISIPTLPLWMGLTAALPPQWPALRVYFGITIILSILGWTGLARVVRGKLLELRSGDFVVAARVSGASGGAVIRRHLLPSFLSYLIVHLTLAVPNMILGETALSFIGLGLKAPVVSWGVLLTSAQNFRTVALSPWLLIPVLFVVATVMTFMFLGDGLRDAADPYK